MYESGLCHSYCNNAMQGFTIQRLGLRINNTWITDALSEVLSTFILSLFVYASGAQYVLTHGGASSVSGKALAAGVGLMIAVYVGMKAAGGSANPNVSVMFCLLGKMKWKKLPVYIIAELIGAFLAAALTYLIYEDLLHAFDGGDRSVYGTNATAQLFISFPNAAITKTTGFFDIVVGTALLTGSIAAITDSNNAGPHSGLIPLIFTFMLYGIIMTFGVNTGAAINTAIDFSGRVFACLIYGSDVFSHDDYWFWVPQMAGITGAIIGSFVYQLMAGNHLPRAHSEKHFNLKDKDIPELTQEKDVQIKSYTSQISMITNLTRDSVTSLDSVRTHSDNVPLHH